MDRKRMKWNDFLNPRSMLTPGIAGSVVMVIANTLWVEFTMPQKWTALVLSFLLIVPILIKFSASWIENVIYFVFNGLIVFALAVNTNFAGRKLQEFATNDRTPSRPEVSMTITNSLVTALNSRETKGDKLRGIQLASSENQGNNTEQDTDETDKEKKKRERDEEKNRNRKNKDDREFFEKWF